MGTAGGNGNRVVVIGGGIAGLTAALRAAELGAQVTVLEQGADAQYPCNTRFSGGLLHVAFYDPERPAAELRGFVDAATRGETSAAMADAAAADGRRLLAWLRGHGVRFMRFSPLEAHRWGLAPPRPVAPGLDWKGRGPDVMLRTLADRLRQHGGEVEFAARALALRMADGRCTGVEGERAGAACTWPAQAVVIADGGFQANAELFRRYIGPSPERILQRGAANCRGDGLQMAIAAGAATSGMGKFYGHVQIRAALTDPRLWPYPELDTLASSALVVGPDGNRVTDEGLGGVSIANALGRLQDPAGATLVCNAAIWDGPGKVGRVPANPLLERFGGELIRADSIAALAARCGIAAAPLEATVAAHNAALAAGTLAQLTPPRSVGAIKPCPVAGGPYIGIPLCVGMTHTLGGVVVDGDGAVLRPDGTPLPGLYAAGSTVAGLDGAGDGPHVGYIGGLIKAVFGLRAAERIAAHVLAK